MKNKREFPIAVIAPKPPKQKISDAEFRRRLKKITAEWRKERLAELRSKKFGHCEESGSGTPLGVQCL